ncbi:MAG: type I DNA topoisomerase [Lachnospiraceae bacterium]|nr:type I DNA topoisomerase [Lachnospiraceae bacterium]
MAKYLVIVESPSKIKTIKKFLGSNYEVVASNGHVRDLPKSSMGFDVEHDYEPHYITIRGKGDILAKLRKEVKKADRVYLATDPDREGEAISWHLAAALKIPDKDIYRITFNEITKNAVQASLKRPRKIDQNLVDAQQTRRIMDRMVGYRISPLLWAKVKRGLSAGRVQSATLRMICDREDEINAFVPEEYWTLDARLTLTGEKKPILAKYYGTKDKKEDITCKEQMDKILKRLKGKDFVVSEVKKSTRVRKAPTAFTTSTLQQEASKVLNFSTQKTMRIAQQLYEGVDVEGHGTIALITYLRTDSTRVSDEAKANAEKYIEKQYGKEFLGEEEKKTENTKNIQDAHEAIRPTDITLLPEDIKDSVPRDQYRLYQLIWKRFTASRMAPAQYETTRIQIDAGDCRFVSNASKLTFEGFHLVYSEPDEEKDVVLSKKIEEGCKLTAEELLPEQHFTQPAPHYTEASLVKAMEEQGIGRPSTYAPTISTLLGRHYVTKEGKSLFVTELGSVVNRVMVESFPSIVDVTFTANFEDLLDSVEEGAIPWKIVLENFYPDLNEAVIQAEQEQAKVQVADEVSDEVCELCGRNLVIKYGPHGKFLACPGFPECKFTKPFLQRTGIPCPKCGKEIVIRMSRKGRRYYNCEGAPECDYISWNMPKKEDSAS